MRTVVALLFLGLMFTAPSGRCAGTPAGVKQTPPTKEGVLALADTYIAAFTPKLTTEDKINVNNLKFNIESTKSVPAVQQRTIAETINTLTVALAGNRSVEAVIVSSAYLVKYTPANARATNLFGTALHSIGKFQDAVLVLEYTRTLDGQSLLVMLNLANACLDVGNDAKAKALLDKILTADKTHRAAYKALAAYWLKKGDRQKALDAMMKAAEGSMVYRITRENTKKVDDHQVAETDSTAVMEKKLQVLKDMVPKTTADIIEDQFPDAARTIRDRYCRLLDSEKMIMPPFPQVNTSGVKNWQDKGQPYVEQWAKAFGANMENAMSEITKMQTGINRSDSDAVKKAKAKAAAQQEMAKEFADAEKMLKQMEGMPGISSTELAKARKKVQDAMQKRGYAPSDASPTGQGAILSDADAGQIGADEVPIGYDYGSIFAVTNYRDYFFIRNSYEAYFQRYFEEFDDTVLDIILPYQKKIAKENLLHEQNMQKIADEEERARQAAEASDNGDAWVFDNSRFVLERRKEELRHKKTVNREGDYFFAQWANVALPQYTRKMKPMLDNYWAVCALYIRNMNQPEVMKTEYLHCKQAFWTYAAEAVAAMSGGNSFAYLGETDEEERQLQADIRAAEEDAKAKLEGYKQQTKTVDDSAFVKWLEDNFALGVAGQFLSLKITPRQLTIEEYIAGMNFKHVYDFKNQTWTTYRSFAAKLDVGIQVGFLKAKIEARVDILESYDTLDCRTGKVIGGGSSFAKGTAGTNFSAGIVSAGGGAEITLDPALESQLSGKLTKSLGLKGGMGDFELGVDAPQ
ncbi:MAG: tetratricopeptide repeat protein [Armatimonadota bacterium]